MRGLVRRLRSRYDYTFFMVRNEWPILLSVVGAILGAVTILPSSVGIVLGVIALVLGVGAFLRDWIELRRRWADYEFTRIAAPFPTATIKPPGAYPDPLYLYVPNRGTALVSDPIDQAVASQPMDAWVDEDLYRLPKSLKASAPYVLPKVNYGRLVFNGKIIGMRGDPLPPETSSPPPIRLHIAQFFDAQCSNEMCTLQVTHRSGERDFDPRIDLLTSSNGQLRTLAESTLADCIGISTVAFTVDNGLVVTRQSSRNIASAQLLAPSGSGSLDPRDLNSASTGRPRREETLQDIVRRGMERELEEETGIRQNEIRRTEVIGFARWLERGAKPEFFGVTALSVTAEDLKEGRVTSGERLFTEGTFTLKIDIPELGRDLVGGTDLLSAPSLPQRIKEQGSLPLLLALRAAALHYVSATR
jgi:8-oxo-dGTP pyrophosphatase MutT (NUDIX family)